MNLFSSPTLQTLERALDGSSLRQKTISQNIANIDTPNYSAKKTVFKHTLDETIAKKNLNAYRTDERHVPFSTTSQQALVKVDKNSMYNHNRNNVDIDREMSDLAQNQIYHNALIERLNGQFNSLRTVVRGGK